MKKLKKLRWLMALFISCHTLNSCDDDPTIVDWAPVTLHIYIHDAQGNNLAQPEMPGLTLTFQGTTYDLQPSPFDGVSSRAIMPCFEGFYYESEFNTLSGERIPARLSFGEIDGAADMDEDIILTWPDKTQNIIHYHCSNHNERKLSVNRYWKIDGVKQESEDVYIKK